MNLSPRILWSIVIAIALATLVPITWKWQSAARSERLQTDRLARLTAQATLINELRGKLPEWALAPKVAGMLAPEVGATLAVAGLPPSAMASLSADPEGQGSSGFDGSTSAAPAQARTRRATLVLGGVTLPQLGAFLQQWRDRQPAWTVATIDVGPEQGSAAAAAKAQTGGDLPLRAVLTLENLSLQRSGSAR